MSVLREKIEQVSSFLVGYGDVAEIAAKRLRKIAAEIDDHSPEAASLIASAKNEIGIPDIDAWVDAAVSLMRTYTAQDVRDTARLNWIEQQLQDNSGIYFLPSGDTCFVQIRTMTKDILNGESKDTLREAIDAAIAQEDK